MKVNQGLIRDSMKKGNLDMEKELKTRMGRSRNKTMSNVCFQVSVSNIWSILWG
jgi:hypothetical protein